MSPRDDDRWFGDDELQREGGVFVPAEGGHKVRCPEDECAPDDYVEDPINEPGVPGTIDDQPYDYGVEAALAADETLDSLDRRGAWSVGATGPADEGEPAPLGRPEEDELWGQQRPLIEEVAATERGYAGLEDAAIPGIVAASGEDANEVLPQSPDGVSATGAASE